MIKNNFNQIQEILNEMVMKEEVSGVNCLINKEGDEFYYQAGYADIDKQIEIKKDRYIRLTLFFISMFFIVLVDKFS